ncbi:MAG: Glycosyl transferase family 39 [Candidatus Daviesbacteria bacterium GW2011_GWA2_38_24]|uniref:Glycosyl transferase family 39 n=1 Tax=Candidatus Daviesbacteria bacterium GW2011_GWA2_38_24 TaxID=1618422 RepID=A0A0G0JK34_9BACT|nr:MAG: Glycosyl transferase family 39 [Candidatus Daviesbacteria bacterium GW2011_GWA2_38_24]KKQ81043.1 MAG: Glycosyl transferase family 39 [Candidatus Daviesbacteria bacterium GW2011_GWA1_38_7]
MKRNLKQLINKKELLIILLIFFTAFAVRWIRIPEYLFFGYEQGRDALVIKDIYIMEKFTLVGPKTDIDGVFHGPIYYYLMTIPYALSGGNPLTASLFLILLSSMTAVVMYYFFKDFLKSQRWAIVGGLLVAFSFEVIVYARWLSNVTLAIPFTALAFLMLWKYHQEKSDKFLYLSVIFASLASSFELLLIFQFIFIYIILILKRIIIFPKLKNIVVSALLVSIIFSPLILFDLRHQNITINSILNNPKSEMTIDIFKSLSPYLFKFSNVLDRTLFNMPTLTAKIIFYLMMLIGLLKVFVYSKGEKQKRTRLVFLLVWGLMSFSTYWISGGLDQNFTASILGLIALFLLAVKTLWEDKKTKVLSFVLIILFIISAVFSINNLLRNKGSFFVTVQNDLNLADQRSIFDFINTDSDGNPYKLIAFTIPSLHPEGWLYLHDYYYPDKKDEMAKLVYVIIEKNVYPVWEKKWIEDLGKTTLIEEREIGLLRVQKRLNE